MWIILLKAKVKAAIFDWRDYSTTSDCKHGVVLFSLRAADTTGVLAKSAKKVKRTNKEVLARVHLYSLSEPFRAQEEQTHRLAERD